MRCSVFSVWLAVILPAAAATTPVFQFSESWIDQVKAVRDPCDTPPCPVFYDVIPANSTSFKVTIPWNGVDPNSLDWDTPVSLRLGTWEFQRTLGEAGNFQPGVSNVTFVETGEDSAGRTITLSRVVVKWSGSSLVVTGYDKMLMSSIVAGDYLQMNATIRDWLPAEVSLGDFNYERNLFITGKASTRLATIGTGDAQYQDYLSTVTVSGSGDFTRPTARITYPVVTYPSTGLRWFSNSIAVRGTASDNSGVTAVLVRVGTNEFQTAAGTNAWTNIVALTPGTNVIQVKAIDADMNESAIVSTRVIFVVTNSLTLAIQPPGSGRVTGVKHGQILEVGRRYTATATPLGITNLFAGWTISQIPGWLGTNATLSFFMLSNMDLTANFAPNPYIARTATYRGLFMPESASELSRTNAGSAVVTLGSKGTFSGTIARANGSHTFTGTLNLAGAATVLAKRLGSAPLIVSLQLDVLGSDGITGTVSDGNWTSPLRAERSPATGLAGRYNFSLPGAAAPSTAPTNTSTGSVTVATSGTFTGSLALADATRVTLAGSITRTAEWPVFVPLYSGTGLMIGWVQFDTNAAPSSQLGTNILWFRPPQPAHKVYPTGFLLQTWLEGNRIIPVPAAKISSASVSTGTNPASAVSSTQNIAAKTTAPTTVPSVVYLAGTTTPIDPIDATVTVSGTDSWRWFIAVNFPEDGQSGILSPAGRMMGTSW